MYLNRYIYQLIVVCLVLLSNSLVTSEYVPVFIWESSKSNEIVPALPRISQETFKEIVQGKLDKTSLVVIFAEPNLSSEDFGEVDSNDNKIFSHLSNIKAETTYLPSVDNPIDVLKSIYDGDVTQATIKSFDVKNIKSNLLVIDLDDVQDNETRNEILQRHDKSIFNIYNTLVQERDDVIAVFTSYHTSWIIPEETDLIRQSRSILQSRALGDAQQVFSAPNFLLYVSDIPYLYLGTSQSYNLTSHAITSSFDSRTLTVLLSKEDEPGVEILILFSNGYWTATNFTIVNGQTRTGLRVRDISAPEPFSYQCNSGSFYSSTNPSIYVSLPGLQMQPFKNLTGDATSFGDAYYCVGFTTAPIWSGIFVVAILITIMSIGLSMMMDIRTMDRFDDPKGKTIQINTSE